MGWSEEAAATYRRALLAGQTAADLELDARETRAFEVAESNLVDEYAAGTLPPAERAAFEQFYLVTPDRRENVALARGILKLARRQRVQRLLMGLAVVLLMGAIFWAGWRRPRESMVLALTAGNTRSEDSSATIHLSRIGQTLVLELAVPGGAPPSVASLTRIGEPQPHLQVNVAGGEVIRIPVASAGLRQGEYIVSVRAGTEFRREFRFRLE